MLPVEQNKHPPRVYKEGGTILPDKDTCWQGSQLLVTVYSALGEIGYVWE